MKLNKSDSIPTQEMKINEYQLKCYLRYEEIIKIIKKTKEKEKRKKIKNNPKKGKNKLKFKYKSEKISLFSTFIYIIV